MCNLLRFQVQARRGNASVAYELLRHGADMTAADANGVTPMFAAARWGKLLNQTTQLSSVEKKKALSAESWSTFWRQTCKDFIGQFRNLIQLKGMSKAKQGLNVLDSP